MISRYLRLLTAGLALCLWALSTAAFAAVVPKFAYVANFKSNDVSVYSINPTTGALTAGATVAAGDGPISVAVDPSGKFAYVANFGSNDVSVYTIDQDTGALTAGTSVAAKYAPTSITVSPSRKFAYTLNIGTHNTHDISVFTIAPNTGALSAVTSIEIQPNTSSLTIAPSGKFAYATNSSSNDVLVYSINPTTGMLTAGAKVAAGTYPVSIAVDPLGKFAYVSNLYSNDISVYTIDQATGVLTARTKVAAGTKPRSIAIAPSGKFAYVASLDSNDVSVYAIDQGSGALSLQSTTMATGSFSIDPSGHFAYVANPRSGDVSIYAVDQGTGELTAVTSVAAGSWPTSIVTIAGGAGESTPPATASAPISNARLFAYAEANYPKLFAGAPIAGQYQQFDYRYYPATQNYFAVDTDGSVFILGPFSGDVIQRVGAVTDFVDAVTAWEAARDNPPAAVASASTPTSNAAGQNEAKYRRMITQAYNVLLGKAPDTASMNGYLAKLNRGELNNVSLWTTIATSPERERLFGTFAPARTTYDGKREQCFGAIGSKCAGVKIQIAGVGPVLSEPRWINKFIREDGVEMGWIEIETSVGSIMHDNCCLWDPNGSNCGKRWTIFEEITTARAPLACSAEWNKATWNSAQSRVWTAVYGPYPTNPDVMAAYSDDLRWIANRRAKLAPVVGIGLGAQTLNYNLGETKSTRVLAAKSDTPLDTFDSDFCRTARFKESKWAFGTAWGICE